MHIRKAVCLCAALLALPAIGRAQSFCFDPPVSYPVTAGSWPRSVVAADLDNDSYPDLAVGNEYNGIISVFQNIGNGTFGLEQTYPMYQLPQYVFAADLNGDGLNDLVSADISSNVSVLINNNSTPGSLSFLAREDYPAPSSPYSIFAADLDADLDQDLLVANRPGGSGTVLVLSNNGNASPPGSRFAAAISYPAGTDPYSAIAADLDGDGKPEIIVVNRSDHKVEVRKNTCTVPGTPSFSATSDLYPVATSPMMVAAADLDGDGNIDLAVASLGGVSVLKNKGAADPGKFYSAVNFVAGSNPSPYTLFPADLDCDGDPDLAVVNAFHDNIVVLQNNSTLTIMDFTQVGYTTALTSPVTVVADDFDKDGVQDLAVTGHTVDNVSVLLGCCVPTGAIAGWKFVDVDGDGVQDAGEPPLDGVEITLQPSVAGILNPIMTDPDGYWHFGPLPVGQYTIRENVPVGKVQTAPTSVFMKATVIPRATALPGKFGNQDTCVTTRQHQFTCLAGNKDGFATGDGPELAAPSSALCAKLQPGSCSNGPRNNCNPTIPGNCSEFDCSGFDRCFGHTFTGCWDPTCTVIHARLCMRLKAHGSGASNDGFGFLQDGAGVWSIPLSDLNSGFWNDGDVYENCLNLESLPASPGYPGITNILAALQDGDLDVLIQDDTEVDYLELIVTVCCNCVTPPENLVAWWPLDETSSPAHDLVGIDNMGVWRQGPIPSPGQVEGALCFDGVDDYVEAQDHPELDFGTGDLTIDAWVRRDPAGTNSPPSVLVDKRDPVSGIGYSLAVSYGKLVFHMSGTNYLTATSCVPPDGLWHFVAVTVNRAAGGGQFYCDGIPLDVFTPVGGNLDNSNVLWIGAGQLVGNQPWRGCIDELELFKRALDAAEVNSIWRADILGKCRPICDCPHQGDVNGDGVIDVFDVLGVIGIAFSGDPDPQDPLCPKTRGDVDNNGITDVFDVIYLIAAAFSGGPGPIDPCTQ